MKWIITHAEGSRERKGERTPIRNCLPSGSPANCRAALHQRRHALRGWRDEIEARALYARHYAPVTEMGFINNDEWGFTIGYSPDGPGRG